MLEIKKMIGDTHSVSKDGTTFATVGPGGVVTTQAMELTGEETDQLQTFAKSIRGEPRFCLDFKEELPNGSVFIEWGPLYVGMLKKDNYGLYRFYPAGAGREYPISLRAAELREIASKADQYNGVMPRLEVEFFLPPEVEDDPDQLKLFPDEDFDTAPLQGGAAPEEGCESCQ